MRLASRCQEVLKTRWLSSKNSANAASSSRGCTPLAEPAQTGPPNLQNELPNPQHKGIASCAPVRRPRSRSSKASSPESWRRPTFPSDSWRCESNSPRTSKAFEPSCVRAHGSPDLRADINGWCCVPSSKLQPFFSAVPPSKLQHEASDPALSPKDLES